MVVTPYEMQRQAGWPVTPLAPLEYHKAGVLREGRISAASLAEALCQLCSHCQGSGWSACCTPPAAAAFSFFRHTGPSFRDPVPLTVSSILPN